MVFFSFNGKEEYGEDMWSLEFGVGLFFVCLLQRELSSAKGGLRKIYPLPTPYPSPSYPTSKDTIVFTLAPTRNKR